MLLSDGEENRGPYIDEVKDAIVDAGVIVDTIAFTQAAEKKMQELAILTGMMSDSHEKREGHFCN